MSVISNNMLIDPMMFNASFLLDGKLNNFILRDNVRAPTKGNIFLHGMADGTRHMTDYRPPAAALTNLFKENNFDIHSAMLKLNSTTTDSVKPVGPIHYGHHNIQL